MLEVKLPCNIGTRIEVKMDAHKSVIGTITSYTMIGSGNPFDSKPPKALANVCYTDEYDNVEEVLVACKDGVFSDDVKIVDDGTEE